MFSKDDVRSLSLQFEFPAEKEESLAEKMCKNVSLSVLKFRETEIMTLFTRIVDGIPLVQMTDSERGIYVSITRNSIRLTLGIEGPPFMVEKEEEKEKVHAKLFSDEALNGVSNDLNFLLGRTMGLFERKGLEIKTSGNMELKKKVKPDLSLDANFSNELAKSMKEFGEVHFSGLAFDLRNNSKITRIECEKSNGEITMSVRYGFSYRQTINILTLMKETLDEVNLLCRKLRVD